MNNIKALLILVAGCLSFSLSAQELTVEVTGDITTASGYLDSSSVTSITARFTYDTTSPLSGDPSGYTYEGAVVRASYEFRDQQGNPVSLPIPNVFELSATSIPDNLHGSFANIGTSFEYSFNTISYTEGSEYYLAYFNLSPNEQPLIFADTSSWPLFVEVTNEPSAFSSVVIIETPGTARTRAELNVHTVRYIDLIADADADGVEDSLDVCPASDLSETVEFDGGLDSGVTNYIDAEGCSIMDHYAKCEPAEQEQEQSFSWFQPVYSGPSYCEKQVAYGLVSDGVIDYSEARALRNALYNSHR